MNCVVTYEGRFLRLTRTGIEWVDLEHATVFATEVALARCYASGRLKRFRHAGWVK